MSTTVKAGTLSRQNAHYKLYQTAKFLLHSSRKPSSCRNGITTSANAPYTRPHNNIAIRQICLIRLLKIAIAGHHPRRARNRRTLSWGASLMKLAAALPGIKPAE